MADIDFDLNSNSSTKVATITCDTTTFEVVQLLGILYIRYFRENNGKSLRCGDVLFETRSI